MVGSSFPLGSLWWEGWDVFVTPELHCPALPVWVGAVGWRILGALGLPLLWAPFSAAGTAPRGTGLGLDNHK